MPTVNIIILLAGFAQTRRPKSGVIRSSWREGNYWSLGHFWEPVLVGSSRCRPFSPLVLVDWARRFRKPSNEMNDLLVILCWPAGYRSLHQNCKEWILKTPKPLSGYGFQRCISQPWNLTSQSTFLTILFKSYLASFYFFSLCAFLSFKYANIWYYKYLCSYFRVSPFDL